MGFVIWYKVDIEEANAAGGLLAAAGSLLGLGLPLHVSNDVFSGQQILDSDITLTMPSGAVAGTFVIKLRNLPSKLVDELKSKQAEGLRNGTPLRAKVALGYFDDPASKAAGPVMEGTVLRIRTSVGNDGVSLTEISGEEQAGYLLRSSRCISWSQDGAAQASAVLNHIASEAGVETVGVEQLSTALPDNFAIQPMNGLEALRRLAAQAAVALVIGDTKIAMGPAVGATSAPQILDSETNLVSVEEQQEREDLPPALCPDDVAAAPAASAARSSIRVTVLGIPGLRAGQRVEFKDKDSVPSGTLRIGEVTHRFSTSDGYTCDLVVVAVEAGQPASSASGAGRFVERMRDINDRLAQERVDIDVGQVRSYEPGSQQKHLATLNYRQSPPSDVIAPSVETPIDTAVQLHHKPIASPFAFHKCGLIVPVYPQMRALLAHNRGLSDDAVLAGFLWSENPAFERPSNEPGDYWLCLPTDVAADQLPSGKAVNDLTDGSGRRVIQAKGLHIVVGADKLPAVGARPEVASDLADQIVIEHKSGTKITIAADGSVKIETTNKDIEFTNGSVTLALSGSAVEVR